MRKTIGTPAGVSDLLQAMNVGSIEYCQNVARQLFRYIKTHHGETQARRIFKDWATPMLSSERRKFNNMSLLTRYDLMAKPNVRQLARQIAKENQEAGKGRRGGADGTSVSNIEALIRRLLRQRKSTLKRTARKRG